jgi:hypothetical protein
MLKLGAILPPQNDQRNNVGVCAGARQGDYSVAHGYNMLCNFGTDSDDPSWLNVWKVNASERVRCLYGWLNATGSSLGNMHLGTPYCSHCGDIETTLHVLRECPLSNIGYVVL